MSSGRLRMVVSACAALTAGLLLRLWMVAHSGQIDGDALVYGTIAKNWMQHGVYGFAESVHGPLPTLIRLPGYPLFLAACFLVFGSDHYTAVMVVQCFVDMATCGLVAGLAGRWFGRRAGLAALFLAVFCPFTATYAAAPLAETLTLATVALVFFAVNRWRDDGAGWNRWLWVTVVGLAYSILLRPDQGLLSAAVVPAMAWMAWHQRDGSTVKRLLPVVTGAVFVVLPLAPWAVRNWRTFHVFEPLAPKLAADPGEFIPYGFYRWYRTWAIDYAATEEVYWNYDNTGIAVSDLPGRAFDSEEQFVRTAELLSDYNRTDSQSAALDVRFAELARERVAADPIRYYVALPVARLVNMLLRPRTELLPVALEWWRWRAHPRQALVAAGFGAVNLGYLVLGGAGLWLWRRRGWGEAAPAVWAMVGFVALRCGLLLTIDNSEPRYTLEFFPLLVVWGSYWFRGEAGDLRKSDRSMR